METYFETWEILAYILKRHRICHPAWGVHDLNSAPGQRSSTNISSSNRIMGACPKLKLVYILWHQSVAMRIRCALTLFRCDSETSNDHGTNFKFLNFCLILAKHVACPGALRVPRHDKVICRYSYARFWVFELSCREGTVKCSDNGHVWLLRITDTRASHSKFCCSPIDSANLPFHKLQVMSVNYWIIHNIFQCLITSSRAL